MAYTLDKFITDCRTTLDDTPNSQGREQIRHDLERLLGNDAFVAAHCSPDTPPGIHTLHEDESGFIVLAHIYAEGKTSPPHDHGASWAIYGQAILHTDMTVWKVSSRDQDDKPEVEAHQTYRLDPGMAGTFEPGAIHSIHFPAGARFVRVTGTDLGKIPTRTYTPKT